MKSDNWRGLYREGWGKRLRPASFAHPAKNSYGLSMRIYEHALAKGWIELGGIVLDPFAGIGGFALEAMRHGLHFVGVELEQRFVDMGQGCDCTGISKADWVRFQGYWDKARYRDGRHWCPECIMKASAVADEREFKPLPLPGTKWAALAKTHQAALFDAAPSASYVRNSGKIPCTSSHRYHGNIETWEQDGMAGTAIIVQGDSQRLGEVLAEARLCLSSPPFMGVVATQDPNFLTPGEQGKRNPSKSNLPNYGSDPANLGNLPDTGLEAALAISSPVYAGGCTHTGGDDPKPDRVQGGEVHHVDYGQEPGQLAQMPEGSFDLALSSPVYHSNTASDDPDKRGGLYRDPKRRDDKTLTAAYSKDEAQLAQMPEGDFALTISSPPFIGSIHEGGHGIDAEKLAGNKAGPNSQALVMDGYGREPGQLAALPEGDHAEACERPTCCVSSPPYATSPIAHCESGSVAQRWRDTGTTLRQRSGGRLPSEQYGEGEQGQLAQMPPGDHAAALEAGAETGRAELCLSSPPWEKSLQASAGIDKEARKRAAANLNVSQEQVTPCDVNPTQTSYGTTEGQLGQQQGSTFWAASRQILEQVYEMLAPGGHAIFVCKRFVRDKKIVEFSTQWAHLCEAVGFKWIHHHKAWLVEDRGAQHTLEGGLDVRQVKRMSFFRRLHAAKYPHLEILYEDVLCFVKE